MTETPANIARSGAGPPTRGRSFELTPIVLTFLVTFALLGGIDLVGTGRLIWAEIALFALAATETGEELQRYHARNRADDKGGGARRGVSISYPLVFHLPTARIHPQHRLSIANEVLDPHVV